MGQTHLVRRHIQLTSLHCCVYCVESGLDSCSAGGWHCRVWQMGPLNMLQLCCVMSIRLRLWAGVVKPPSRPQP